MARKIFLFLFTIMLSLQLFSAMRTDKSVWGIPIERPGKDDGNKEMVLAPDRKSIQWKKGPATGDGVTIEQVQEEITNRVPTVAAVQANTAKKSFTDEYKNKVDKNSAKTGITPAQANAITENTAKNSFPDIYKGYVETNNRKQGISEEQAQAITNNTAKYTQEQVNNLLNGKADCFDNREILEQTDAAYTQSEKDLLHALPTNTVTYNEEDGNLYLTPPLHNIVIEVGTKAEVKNYDFTPLVNYNELKALGGGIARYQVGASMNFNNGIVIEPLVTSTLIDAGIAFQGAMDFLELGKEYRVTLTTTDNPLEDKHVLCFGEYMVKQGNKYVDDFTATADMVSADGDKSKKRILLFYEEGETLPAKTVWTSLKFEKFTSDPKPLFVDGLLNVELLPDTAR